MSGRLRVLCLSNMYPGPADPDYGAFVADMVEALRARGLRVEVAAIDSRAHGLRRTPAKYARLAARAAGRARRADVIYGHYLFPTGAIAAAVGGAARRPWVLTAHGRDVRNLAHRSLRRASRPGIERAAGVIAVSDHLAAELRASGLRLPPLDVINMGVDLERFGPGERRTARRVLGLATDGPLVLAAGGLTPRKNPLGLLAAFALLHARRPDARLAYLGDGPLAGALSARAGELGLAEAVTLAGSVAHSQVPTWMVACDVLALVSEVEPLGQVALEALATGRPVIATRHGGTPEVVPEGPCGAIVEPSDAGAVAAAAERLLAAPPAEAACRALAGAHALERQAERVAAVLARAAGHGSAAARSSR